MEERQKSCAGEACLHLPTILQTEALCCAELSQHETAYRCLIATTIYAH